MQEKLFTKKSVVGDVVKAYKSNLKIAAHEDKFEEMQKCANILSALTNAAHMLEQINMFEDSNAITQIIVNVTKHIDAIETPKEEVVEKPVDINEAWDQNTAVFAEKIKSVIRK